MADFGNLHLFGAACNSPSGWKLTPKSFAFRLTRPTALRAVRALYLGGLNLQWSQAGASARSASKGLFIPALRVFPTVHSALAASRLKLRPRWADALSQDACPGSLTRPSYSRERPKKRLKA